MKRLVIAATLCMLVMLALIAPASAAKRWCMTDPIVELDGVEYQLFVSIPEENVPQVNGPILFEMYSPRDTDRELIFVDDGYNGFGERIEFKDHDASFIHSFFIQLPRTGSDFPMLVDVYRDGILIEAIEGTSAGVEIDVEIVTGALDGVAHLPLVLGGINYDVVVHADDAYLHQINGDLSFEVASPQGVSQLRGAVEPGFNGYGSKVAFKEHSKSVHTLVLQVQRSGSDFPIKVEVYRNGVLMTSVTGTTNGMSVSVAR